MTSTPSNGSYGSRKFILGMLTLMFGTLFGTLCAYKGVDLASAGIYWGAVGASTFGYHYANVMEKKNATANGNGNGS